MEPWTCAVSLSPFGWKNASWICWGEGSGGEGKIKGCPQSRKGWRVRKHKEQLFFRSNVTQMFWMLLLSPSLPPLPPPPQELVVCYFSPLHFFFFLSMRWLLFWQAGRSATFLALSKLLSSSAAFALWRCWSLLKLYKTAAPKLKHGTGGENANQETPFWEEGIEANKKMGKFN